MIIKTVLFAITFILAMVFAPVPAAYAAGADLTGTIKTSNDTDICAMVLASGQFMFSCSPDGVFSLSGLPSEQDGKIKCQIYADGFFPKIDTLTGSSNDTVIMSRSGICPNYNTSYNPGFVPNSAFKRIDIAGKVLQQDSQTPLCAMVLANGQHMFSVSHITSQRHITLRLDISTSMAAYQWHQLSSSLRRRYGWFSIDTRRVRFPVAPDYDCCVLLALIELSLCSCPCHKG